MPKAPTHRTPPPVVTPVELREDGTTILRWRDHEVFLDLPLIKQLASYSEESKRIDDADRPTMGDLLRSETRPYPALYARIIRELGDQEVSIEDLPPWLLDASIFSQLLNHWWSNPLARSVASSAVTQALASMMTNAASSPPPPSEE